MIDTQSMLDELCLDATDETTQLITDLLSQSESIIRDSVDKTKSIATYEQDPIFVRASKTLCTQLYYDRALTGGMSLGLQMMINHLKGEVEADGYKPNSTV